MIYFASVVCFFEKKTFDMNLFSSRNFINENIYCCDNVIIILKIALKQGKKHSISNWIKIFLILYRRTWKQQYFDFQQFFQKID